MVDIIKQDMTDIWAVAGDVVAPDSAKVRAGWAIEAVPRQWWNWFENRQDTNIAYMLQKGIPEWDQFTEYLNNRSYVQRNNIIYKSILTGTNKDPATQPTYWVKAFVESSSSLEALKALTPAADRLAYFSGASTAALTTLTAFARTILDDVDAPAMRATLAAQAADVNLTALSGVSAATNTFPYWNSSTTMLAAPITAFGRSLLDDNNASEGRTTLNLGTIATYDVTTSQTDNTVGRISKVGDFGENGGTPITLDTPVDANGIVVSGTYVWPSGGINLPTAAAYYLKHIAYPNPGYAKQFAWNITLNTGFARVQVAGVWTSWSQDASQADVISTLFGYGLGTTTSGNVADLNSITVTSFNTYTTGATNSPPIAGGASGSVLTISASANSKTQHAISFQATDAAKYNRSFTRTMNNGTWGPWKEYVDSDTLTTTLSAYALNGVNTDITSVSNVTLAGVSLIGTAIRTSASDSTTVPASSGGTVTPALRMSDTGGSTKSTIAVQGYTTTTTTNGPTISGTRSLGAVGTHSAVSSGRAVLTLLGSASDGTKYNPNARIDFYTSEAQTTSAAGGEIRFLTTPLGALAPTTAATITPSGNLVVVGSLSAASAAFATALPVTSGGTGATTAVAARANLSAVGYDATTGSATLPAGTTAQRSGSPVNGMIRYNSDLSVIEGYQGGAWSNVGGLAYGNNRVINGAALVQQRGSVAFPNNTSGYAGPDRFYAQNGNSAGGSFNQSSGTLSDGGFNKPAVLQISTTPATDLTGTKFWSGITQYIEGYNCADLIGHPLVLSFLFRATATGTYSVSLRASDGSFSFVSTFNVTVSNVGTRYTIQIPAVPSGFPAGFNNGIGMQLWIGTAHNGTFTAPAPSIGSWQNANYINATGSVNWTGTAGNSIGATEIQLEPGIIATEYNHKTYGEELAQCQRYFQLRSAGWTMYQAGGNGYNASLPHPVTMRATPTVTVVGSPTVVNTTSPGVIADTQNLNQTGTATVTGTVVWTGNVTLNAEL